MFLNFSLSSVILGTSRLQNDCIVGSPRGTELEIGWKSCAKSSKTISAHVKIFQTLKSILELLQVHQLIKSFLPPFV
jgi:hypothetical protein